MTLQELGRMLGVEVKGEADYAILGIRDVECLSSDQLPEENRLYFVESKAVLKRHPLMAEHGAVLTTKQLSGQFRRALISAEDVRLVFIKVLKIFDKAPAFEPGISSAAKVDSSARIAESSAILPGAVVMANAVIEPGCVLYPGSVVEPYAEVGEGTVLYPRAVVGHHCVVGKRCIIYGGAVIGADGFGYYDRPGQRHKIPQIGNVVISDHVEIGAGCTIDRATIESTTIGTYTKIDDQVHIGHNCRIGRFIYIIGNTAIGGSVVIEDGAMISGMVIVKDHVRVAKGSGVMGMSGLAQDTEPGQAYFGTPALPAREAHKMHAALRRLPDLIAKVRRLEAQLLADRAEGPRH
ncbi:MAG: UDP-3-O-(3-hydroxymyristoyl)glucosamine N-acyltransferase [Elusimicrobia bacterium]|nr:UDP-3-O-(3-hydroxymyristoyl)glucosamine N-acyltransferase [Elusimicrobiota bacterium]